MNKAQLKKKYGEEKIFVIPSALGVNIPDRYTKKKHTSTIFSKYDSIGRYVYRYDAEYNSDYLQIIPYFFITNEDETLYYACKRLKGDARLVDKMSIGFGGHVDSSDGHINAVLKALEREMNEELEVNQKVSFRYHGTMLDLESETKEHLGLIFSIKVNEENIKIRETENLSGLWLTKQQLYDNYGKFEGWSKFLIDDITH